MFWRDVQGDGAPTLLLVLVELPNQLEVGVGISVWIVCSLNCHTLAGLEGFDFERVGL